MKDQQWKLTAIAAAVAAVCSGSAGAAEVGAYFGAGATAPINGLRAAIFTNANLCGAPASGTTITYYETGGTTLGGAIWAVQCTNATGALAINYDSNGGSWKGLGIYPGLFNAAQADATAGSPNHYNWLIPATGAATVVPGGCVLKGATVDAYSGATVTDYTGCTSVSATGNPTFGFTDVEKALFVGAPENQPVPTANINTFTEGQAGLDPNFATDVSGAELAGYPVPVFGIVFGVAASGNLYNAMQVDQAAQGLLPSSCAPAGVASGVSGPPLGVCAPIITEAMYRSVMQEKVNNINNGNIQQLFFGGAPAGYAAAALTLSRRDQGSGTQAFSNYQFFHLGCGSASQENGDLKPAVPSDTTASINYFVDYNQTTGGVTGELATPPHVNSAGLGVAIGWVSDEKDTATGTGGGAGFLKLDGVYPNNTAAALGRYNAVSDENMHAATNANANLVAAIQTAVTAYSNVGIVNTATKAAAWPALGAGFNGNPNNSYYGNNGFDCGGWRSN